MGRVRQGKCVGVCVCSISTHYGDVVDTTHDTIWGNLTGINISTSSQSEPFLINRDENQQTSAALLNRRDDIERLQMQGHSSFLRFCLTWDEGGMRWRTISYTSSRGNSGGDIVEMPNVEDGPQPYLKSTKRCLC